MMYLFPDCWIQNVERKILGRPLKAAENSPQALSILRSLT